jgi:hypothetical protein
MSKKKGKFWLAVVALCCLSPAAFARHHDPPPPPPCHGRNCNPMAVPEGGSAAIYLLGAGLTCVGAMFLRSKLPKPTQS